MSIYRKTFGSIAKKLRDWREWRECRMRTDKCVTDIAFVSKVDSQIDKIVVAFVRVVNKVNQHLP